MTDLQCEAALCEITETGDGSGQNTSGPFYPDLIESFGGTPPPPPCTMHKWASQALLKAGTAEGWGASEGLHHTEVDNKDRTEIINK